MKWFDLADEQASRIAEALKTDPNYKENPVVAKVNWRSEDFCWRVAVDDLQAPEEERLWNVWDMRGAEEPWGPKPKGLPTGKPLLLLKGLKSFKRALVAAEVAASSKPLRLGIHLVGLAKHTIDQARSLVQHERSH